MNLTDRLQERVNILQSAIEAQDNFGPIVATRIMVVCNGCERSVTVRSVLDGEFYLRGWSLGPHGAERDFCPRCVVDRAGVLV